MVKRPFRKRIHYADFPLIAYDVLIEIDLVIKPCTQFLTALRLCREIVFSECDYF
jgi:hypothetical protein